MSAVERVGALVKRDVIAWNLHSRTPRRAFVDTVANGRKVRIGAEGNDKNLWSQLDEQKRPFLSLWMDQLKTLETLAPQTLCKTAFDLSRFWPHSEGRTLV